MQYTDEVIIKELIRLVGFSEQQAIRVMEKYRQAGQIDELIELIESEQSPIY